MKRLAITYFIAIPGYLCATSASPWPPHRFLTRAHIPTKIYIDSGSTDLWKSLRYPSLISYSAPFMATVLAQKKRQQLYNKLHKQRLYKNHRCPITLFSADLKYMVTCSANGPQLYKISTQDTDLEKLLKEQQTHKKESNRIIAANNRDEIAYSTIGGTTIDMYRFPCKTYPPEAFYEGIAHKQTSSDCPIISMTWSPGGQLAAMTTRGIAVWDSPNELPSVMLTSIEHDQILRMTWQDEETIMGTTAHNTKYIWSKKNPRNPLKIVPPKKPLLTETAHTVTTPADTPASVHWLTSLHHRIKNTIDYFGLDG